MKKLLFALTAAAALCVLSGCTGGNADAEIKIPVLGADTAESFTHATAELRDLSVTSSVGAGVEYAFAERLSIDFDTNLIEYNVKKGTVLNEGDIIAVFDSSALDYELRNQQIITDDAYSRYLSSGSESARLEYEQEAKRLELVNYKISQYTVRAPYDCVVSSAEIFDIGQTVTAGTTVCSVAKTGEAFVTVDGNRDLFKFGMAVGIKFGTREVYSGHVVMLPGTGGRGVNSKTLIAFDEGEYERANEDFGGMGIVSSGWATVVVKTFSAHDALCVPQEAVMLYSGETYCYLDKGSDRIRVQVETGETVDGYTVILSGLSEGDSVSY